LPSFSVPFHLAVALRVAMFSSCSGKGVIPLLFDFGLQFLQGAVYLLKSAVIALSLSERSLDRLL